MSGATTQIAVLVGALATATAFGLAWQRRWGEVRAGSVTPTTERERLLATVGVGSTQPTIVHFSADWCGPCSAVRRVVGQVVVDLAHSPKPPAEVEVDIDEHPELAKELGVLSLPTTFIFDDSAVERFRIAGVPSKAALQDALAQVSS